jgi:hypothetical protein
MKTGKSQSRIIDADGHVREPRFDERRKRLSTTTPSGFTDYKFRGESIPEPWKEMNNTQEVAGVRTLQ